MTQTWIQKAFKPVRAYAPSWASSLVRRAGTAILTPLLFSRRTGHWRSSFSMKAVSRQGDPLPWYTYPCIDFLKYRDYADKTVLEFGAGQSTLWWGRRAQRVLALEGDPAWLEHLKMHAPATVDLQLVPVHESLACVAAVHEVLAKRPEERFDVIVIDGFWRYQMIEIAARLVRENGVIVCDNAEGYGFFEGFKDRGFSRVDFFGHAPGVVLPHCTSLYFKGHSFVFQATHPIPVIAKER